MKKLILEIHRRSLWQVLGIYLVGSWVALQIVDVLANNFGLPDWFPAFALALLVIGLPIVLATAFVQDRASHSTENQTRTPVEGAHGAAAPAVDHRLFTWRNTLFGGVASTVLWGLVAGGWFLYGRSAGTPGSDPAVDYRSIAVLPFSSRSATEGPDAQFFAEGMHDDLLTQLSKIASLTVISRTSVMQFRDTEKGIPEIAAQLGVGTVLEGGVDRAGDRLRVNVQLIEARTDRHLWAETYDEELTAANVFAIRADLAKKIASALEAKLSPDLEAQLAARPTESLAAYDLYTRGNYVLSVRGFTRPGAEAAADLFRQAIRVDPAYAAAHAGLANTYLTLWNLGYLAEAEALPQAREAAERALELDPNLAEAYVTRSRLLQAELQHEGARSDIERALELNPGSAAAHSVHSALLLDDGKPEEALAEARRAVELDPLSVATWRSLVARLAWMRKHDETIEAARNLLELDPDQADAFYYMGMSYTYLGRHQDAIAAFKRATEMTPEDPYYPAAAAWAYALAGEREKALEYVEAALEAGVPLKEAAIVYATLGDMDRAFEYLDRAAETEPGTLNNLRADPSAEPLRGDPRFASLMKRLGIE